VLDHRLAPRDPLAADDVAAASELERWLLDPVPVPLATAVALAG
jgi:hypothetical protein